jgi:DNA-binding transcriptional MerR regulator
MALTVTRLARACGLARGTILYYESIGLLTRPPRSAGNYRLYSDKDLKRLRQIRGYRDAGLNLSDIRSILDKPVNQAAGVLERRLLELTGEIARLREHQRSIGRLLQSTNQLRRMSMVTKEKWVEVMRAAGFSDDAMHRWHAEFEKLAPEEHQEFLEFLRIPGEEVRSIRDWSRRLRE